MSGKKFSAFTEQVNDARNAVNKLQPVIGIIKELASKEDESFKKRLEINNVKKDCDLLEETISQLSDKDMAIAISAIAEEKQKELVSREVDIRNLDADIDDIENEISEYLKYSHTFFYELNIVEELFKRAIQKDCSTEKFFTILLLLHSESVTEVKPLVAETAKKYSEDVEDPLRKHILSNLEGCTQEDILRLIKESI